QTLDKVSTALNYAEDYVRNICGNLFNARGVLHIRLPRKFRARRKRDDVPSRLRSNWPSMFSHRIINNQGRFSQEQLNTERVAVLKARESPNFRRLPIRGQW
ncbi:hypothetical protein OAO39_01050, partial [Pirellulaceae bacterium]|nr:hypothetical protein [Pirellulaceae bacterium]